MSEIRAPAFGKHPNWEGPKKEECRICLANPVGPCPYHTAITNYPPCEGCDDPFGCHFTDDAHYEKVYTPRSYDEAYELQMAAYSKDEKRRPMWFDVHCSECKLSFRSVSEVV